MVPVADSGLGLRDALEVLAENHRAPGGHRDRAGVWAKPGRVSTQVACRACRRAADVDCVVGESPCLAPSDDAGYLIVTGFDPKICV